MLERGVNVICAVDVPTAKLVKWEFQDVGEY